MLCEEYGRDGRRSFRRKRLELEMQEQLSAGVLPSFYVPLLWTCVSLPSIGEGAPPFAHQGGNSFPKQATLACRLKVVRVMAIWNGGSFVDLACNLLLDLMVPCLREQELASMQGVEDASRRNSPPAS